MGLKSMQANTSAGAGNRTPREGVIFKVESFEGAGVKGDSLTMKGTALMGNDIVKEGEEVTVVMGPSFNDQRVGPLTKGMGKQPGSVLMLDSCYRDRDTNNVMSNWANTITSQKEMASDPESPHNNRSVLSVISEVPTLRVPNRDRKEGEPETIYWRLNADTMTVGDNTYDRQWLGEKTAKAGLKESKIHFDMYEPQLSQVVSDKEALAEAISALVEGGRSALIRAFDNEGEVMIRKAMGNQDNDAQASLDYLIENGVIPRVENDVLFSEIAAGNVTLEVIPMDRKYYVGSTKESILSGFTGSKSKQMIGSFGMADNTANLADVYLAVQTMNPGQEDEWAMPLGAMVRGGSFAGDFDKLPTPHFAGEVAAAPEAAASAAESDGEEPVFDSPGMK